MRLIDVDNLIMDEKHGGWFGTVRSCRGESTSFNYNYKYCPYCGAKMKDYQSEREEGKNYDNDEC